MSSKRPIAALAVGAWLALLSPACEKKPSIEPEKDAQVQPNGQAGAPASVAVRDGLGRSGDERHGAPPLCYGNPTGAMLLGVRAIDARYEDGILRPERPLRLRPGERVAVIVMRRPDPARWDLARLAASGGEDADLAGVGLDDWARTLDDEDRR